MGYTPVSGRLHTRYSPVRRSSSLYCYIMLPLDLHVLSLSLAFILSQDQTLRCINCFVLLRIRFLFQVLTVLIFNTCTTCWYVNLSKNYCLSFDCGCKGKDFILTAKFFRRKIQSFFWATATVGFLLRTSNLIPFPQVTSFIISGLPFSLECGCKSSALQHTFQIFHPLFFIYFSTGETVI